MPAAVACPVRVTGAPRRVLIRRARGQRTPYRDKIRAQIVLRAADRQTNTRIAAELGITVDTVRAWRGRFAEHGLAGLRDRPRSGRPSRFTPGAGSPGHVAGLPGARPCRGTVVPVVMSGTGPRSGGPERH
jgi:hypothetical protein